MTRGGYTLIELMIVVAIIGILAAIAVPQFAKVVQKSKEGATKGNLGTIRSALAVYYADTEGMYPADNLAALTLNSKYLSRVFEAHVEPWHDPSNLVATGDYQALLNSQGGGWWYYNIPTDPQWGQVYVNCIHTDLKGVTWTSY